MTEQEMMGYFGFDESDLIANRNGSLSPQQIARLTKDDRSTRKKFLVIGVVCAAIMVVPTLVLWFIDELKYVGWYSLLWVIPGGLLAFVFIRAGLRPGIFSLKKVTGAIKIVQGGSYNEPGEIYHELLVGRKRFGIGPVLADNLQNEQGNNYAVYYYWGSDTTETDLMDSYIMSLERLSTGDKHTD